MKRLNFIIIIMLFGSLICLEKDIFAGSNKQEILKLKEQLSQEKDVITKIDLETQIEIKNLEDLVQEKTKSFNQYNNDMPIQQAISESLKIKQDVIFFVDELEKLLNKNNHQIMSFYNEQNKMSHNSIKKTQWETEEEYNVRVKRNKEILEENKKRDLFINEDVILQMMVKFTDPFMDMLRYFNTEKFSDNNESKARLVSIEEFNVSDFLLNVECNQKKYLVEFDFAGIGKENAELMYQTQYQFDVEPLFSVNGDLNKELTAFKIKHKGMKIEKIIDVPGISGIKNINKLSKYRCIYKLINTKYNLISAGGYHSVGLKEDGTVLAVGNNDNGQCNVEHWKDIKAISAGNCHTVGLKNDGKLVACGNNYYGQCNVIKWENIVAISAGKDHTVGLKEDGTVVAAGNNVFGQCDVGKWKDIVAISAGGNHTVGLKKDGTVVATGYNKNRQCNVRDWKGISEISAGEYHTLGLMKNKTVVAVGNNDNWQCNIARRENIIAISAAEDHSVGLREDGTVVATGSNDYGQCDVNWWTDVVEIAAGLNFTIGLRKDGKLFACGNNYYYQCDIEDWKLKKE